MADFLFSIQVETLFLIQVSDFVIIILQTQNGTERPSKIALRTVKTLNYLTN